MENYWREIEVIFYRDKAKQCVLGTLFGCIQKMGDVMLEMLNNKIYYLDKALVNLCSLSFDDDNAILLVAMSVTS